MALTDSAGRNSGGMGKALMKELILKSCPEPAGALVNKNWTQETEK